MRTADSAERHPGTVTRVAARVVLTIYAISLTLIALWPVPVDAGAGGFLRVVTRVLPAAHVPAHRVLREHPAVRAARGAAHAHPAAPPS